MHETSRETFLCCISGLDVRNMGLIIALKNHDHLHRKVSLKYYKSKIFLQGQLAQIYFILCKITHGLLTKEPFNRPVVSSYTLTISLLNKNNLLYCSSWVFGPDVWWNNWVWNCWVLFYHAASPRTTCSSVSISYQAGNVCGRGTCDCAT